MKRLPRLGLVLALLFILSAWPGLVEAQGDKAARGKARVGRTAPWFKLKNLTGGRTWTQKNVQGTPTVLVVGRTQEAAPSCKTWMLALLEHQPVSARVLQVIVVKKAWYLPKGLILKKIRGFIPRRHHDKVLLEWYTVFSDVWGIPKVDDPFIYLLDAKGVVRHVYRGKYSKAPMKKLKAALAQLK